MTITTTTSAGKKDILFAASRLAKTGTFTADRVIRVLSVYGIEVRAVDVSARIASVLLGSGSYCTDERGTFASV